MVADRVTLLLIAVVAVIIARNPTAQYLTSYLLRGLDLVLYLDRLYCLLCSGNVRTGRVHWQE